MRMSPIFHHKEAKRWFGIFLIGVLFGWFFFLLTYGLIYERQVERIKQQDEQLNALKKDLAIWRDEIEQKNAAYEKHLYLQHIEIKVEKADNLDSLTIHSIKEKMKEQLRPLLKKEISQIASNKEFIFQSIEKSVIELDDETYEVQVVHLYLFTTLELHVTIKRVV